MKLAKAIGDACLRRYTRATGYTLLLAYVTRPLEGLSIRGSPSRPTWEASIIGKLVIDQVGDGASAQQRVRGYEPYRGSVVDAPGTVIVAVCPLRSDPLREEHRVTLVGVNPYQVCAGRHEIHIPVQHGEGVTVAGEFGGQPHKPQFFTRWNNRTFADFDAPGLARADLTAAELLAWGHGEFRGVADLTPTAQRVDRLAEIVPPQQREAVKGLEARVANLRKEIEWYQGLYPDERWQAVVGILAARSATVPPKKVPRRR
jgi:hypothetical protein